MPTRQSSVAWRGIMAWHNSASHIVVAHTGIQYLPTRNNVPTSPPMPSAFLMQAVAGKVNEQQLTRRTSRRAGFPPAKPYICHPPTLTRPNGVAKTLASPPPFTSFILRSGGRLGWAVRGREPALCAFLMIMLLLPIIARREDPLVDTVGCNYCCWLRVPYLDFVNACTPRMMTDHRWPTTRPLDVECCLRRW